MNQVYDADLCSDSHTIHLYSDPISIIEDDPRSKMNRSFEKLQFATKENSDVEFEDFISSWKDIENTLNRHWNSLNGLADFFDRTANFFRDSEEGACTLTVQTIGDNKLVFSYITEPISMATYKQVCFEEELQFDDFAHEREQLSSSYNNNTSQLVVSVVNDSDQNGFGLYVNSEGETIRTSEMVYSELGFFKRLLYRWMVPEQE